MAKQLRRGAEDTRRERAEVERIRQGDLQRQAAESRRVEEIVQRLESVVAQPLASGSKRKRDNSDDEYDPTTDLSLEENNLTCYNCRIRGIRCERTG